MADEAEKAGVLQGLNPICVPCENKRISPPALVLKLQNMSGKHCSKCPSRGFGGNNPFSIYHSTILPFPTSSGPRLKSMVPETSAGLFSGATQHCKSTLIQNKILKKDKIMFCSDFGGDGISQDTEPYMV